jgi:hypothetical protein
MKRDISDKYGGKSSDHDRGPGRDRDSSRDTRSDEEKFLQAHRRFSFHLLEDPHQLAAVNTDIVADRKVRKRPDRRSDSERRSNRDRRSGLDTRSEEEQFLQGERRSRQDRRSDIERRYRSFKKARAFARSLGLRSVDDWRTYNKSGMKPNDIPVAPHHVYANDGWAGWSDWLGASAIATYSSHYRFFGKARAFVYALWLGYVRKRTM